MVLSPKSRLLCRRLFQLSTVCLFLLVLFLAFFSCSGGNSDKLPANFRTLSTADKMEYLMANMSPDSVARYVCDAAMGKVYNSRIELQEARAYAFEHYNEDEQVAFETEFALYEEALPLHEKVKFAKLAATEDPDVYSYELGLKYVGSIREEGKDATTINDELGKLRKECKTDPEFYKRFMKGFKLALEYDRGHDLDDNIYKQFISYPDFVQ